MRLRIDIHADDIESSLRVPDSRPASAAEQIKEPRLSVNPVTHAVKL